MIILYIPVSCYVGVSPSQPSADKVKEVTAFSKECLEKIERARIEKDYNKVRNTTFSFQLRFLLSYCLSPYMLHFLLSNVTFPCVLSILSQVVKLCHECLEKQENVLADTHLYKLRVLSVASEVLSYQQLFSEAADYARRMVGGYM